MWEITLSVSFFTVIVFVLVWAVWGPSVEAIKLRRQANKTHELEGETYGHPLPVLQAVYDALPTPPLGTRFDISIDKGENNHPHITVTLLEDAPVNGEFASHKQDLTQPDYPHTPYEQLYEGRTRANKIHWFNQWIIGPTKNWATQAIIEYKAQHFQPEFITKIGGYK